MKSLSLSRPVILIMIGTPGSGKSFFARQFAETFNVPLVSYDGIRSTLFETPKFDREQESFINTIAYQQLIELLKTEKTILLDGGHNVRADRHALAKRALKAGYDTLTIWVQTDEPTSMYRATKRSDKRAGDAYNASISADQFKSLSRQLTPPSPQEPHIVISGKHTYATQAKAVLKKLVAPRQLTAQKPNAYSAQNYDAPQPPTTQPRKRNVIIN